MKNESNKATIGNRVIIVLVIINLLIVREAFLDGPHLYWWLFLSLPLLLFVIYDVRQRKHAILRHYPIIGCLRHLLETVRPEPRQYFSEPGLDAKPFNRRQRSIVSQRAKNEKQTVAFGIKANPAAAGYEWLAHSMYPVSVREKELRVWIGNHQCLQRYHASILNIGAMNCGALGKSDIMSLNESVKMGGFAQNTGEGGISDYHLRGGDLIWQIGTGYFGCRDAEGRFSSMAFRKNALRPQVKMIELKLSQVAGPGHGGILAAQKNTPKIAAIRLVKAGTTVHSPARHAEFGTPEGMVEFLQLLRELSEGKPVGIKLCIGDKQEFIGICHAITNTGIIPDFITIDGAEDGTGAAPLECTDHLGLPLYEALAFASKTLQFFGLKDHIRLIAAGEIITGFDLLKAISLGASAGYSAMGMMMAPGCNQALVCESGKCPVGLATQDPRLCKELHPSEKRVGVANYHANTIRAAKELMEACGFRDMESIQPSKFFRIISGQETISFEQIYFSPKRGSVLNNFQSLLN